MSTSNQTVLFQRLRWRQFSNGLHKMLRQTPVRLWTMAACTMLIWGTLFAVSFFGFRELLYNWEIGINRDLFGIPFNLAFVLLAFLLVFSTGIILYSSLFQAKESSFLLSSPVTADHVFVYKFQGALAYSSWAFLLLGSPFVLAYGINVRGGAPWYFYPIFPFFFLGYILLPGSVGAFLTLLLVNFFPRRTKHIFFAAGALLLTAVGCWTYFQLWPSARQLLVSADAISDFLATLSVFQNKLLPTTWMSEGLQSAATGDYVRSLYYLALIWSNGLLLYVVTVWVAKRLYRRGFDLLISGGSSRRRYHASWLDRLVYASTFFIDRPTRLLIGKDFRTFRRDPAQLAQIVIFGALAGSYFVILRWVPKQDGIAFLNLIAASFLICAYTGRFIYPMLSLEGRRFWILGLLPLNRSRLLWSKFAFAAIGTIVAGELTIVGSNLILGTAASLLILHATAIAVLAAGLSGISVGMGATLPNFRETDPSKIAVGFGGTLNLVLGLFFQFVVIVVMVLPTHIQATLRGQPGFEFLDNPWWLPWGIPLGILIGAAAVLVPMRSGMRTLEKMEF